MFGSVIRPAGAMWRFRAVLAAVLVPLLFTVGVAGNPASAGLPYHARPGSGPHGFTLAATGDLLIHTPVWRTAEIAGGHDFWPQLSAVAEHLGAADIGLCHLEVPLDPDGPYSSYPRFNAPAALATGIARAGWDICSTASNHSADRGFEGLISTLDALDGAGVDHRGMYRSEEDSLAADLYNLGGLGIGFISATYGLNGLPAPGGHEWSVLRIDPEAITLRAQALRDAGAEVVIASLHWGDEYRHSPSAYQRTNAQAIMDTGLVDAIIGHHAHVVQPVEWINGRPVVFGLGNFLSGQRPTPRRDGAIVLLTFVRQQGQWSVSEVTAQPTYVDGRYHVVPAAPGDAGALGVSARRTLSIIGVPQSPPPGDWQAISGS